MYCWNLRVVVVVVSFALGLPLVLEVGIGDLGNGGSSSPNEEVEERAEYERLKNWEEATSEEGEDERVVVLGRGPVGG